MTKQAEISEERRAIEYLANERTFLAWIRTSVAVIGLGFLVAKFSVWLRELAVRFDPQMETYRTATSMPTGVAMMAFGGLLALLAAWRYHAVNRAIASGVVRADRGLVILVTVAVALLCIAMIFYMLLTSYHA